MALSLTTVVRDAHEVPTPARSVSNTYPVPGLKPPLWPGGQNIVHEIRGVFELLNSHEFKIQLFCHFFVPAERNCGTRRAARLIAGFGPIRPSYAPLERM